jgi:hypothetical protein
MLSEEISRTLLERKGLTQQEIVLICLAARSIHPKTVGEVRSYAIRVGIRPAWSWNVSSILAQSKGKAVRIKNGWQLTVQGWNAVRRLAEVHLAETVWRDDSFSDSLRARA